jgi:D-sedoheptulose 7-phosphate isomerase
MTLELANADRYLTETVTAIQALQEHDLRELAELVMDVQSTGGIMWILGNGGSASTGAHLACDIGKGVSSTLSAPIRTISLNEQLVAQSAWANDFGYENALTNQLRQLAKQDDLILIFSGSGDSKNVVNAARWAQENKIKVAGLLGANGGRVSEYLTHEFRVASRDMQVIENVHLVVVHWLFKALVRT